MEDKFCIQNMNLYYGDFHALKDVSMNIPANEITAFIGPSGCGKSTFLKSLNRMNDLVEGTLMSIIFASGLEWCSRTRTHFQ